MTCAARLDPVALARLVEAFESASLELDGFHHREHMLVALWLIAHDPPETALDRMRAGLHRLLARVGRDAYHETATVFWMRALAYRLALTDPASSLAARMAEVLDWCDAVRPLHVHYSPERLEDPLSRRVFLEPDLAPMPPVPETPSP